MSKRYIARGLMADKSAKIEALLRKLGGQGVALKELRSSISDKLPEAIQSQLRRVHFLRNQAVHEDEFQISDQDLREFAATADDVIFQLELMINSDAEDFSLSDSKTAEVPAALESLPSPISDGDREILRKRELAAVENRRLAKEMDTKGSLVVSSGLSSETKARLKSAAITVGIHVIGSMFKR